jgi:MoaA/NifB/PqqE/SkfB family radical SAM enzyme
MITSPRIYDHGNYMSFWDPNTGMFIRGELPDGTDPEWSPAGPELADIHITDYCPMHCSYCYRESNASKSTHMSVGRFESILKSMCPTVLQIAIGGGSPQHHPEFISLLEIANARGIVPSYTTNGLDMTDAIVEASKRYCGAVAVSLHTIDGGMQSVQRLLEAQVPTGIHVILSKNEIGYWTRMLEKANKGKGILGGKIELYSCIFLMHKPVGRASWDQHPTREQKSSFVKALKNYKGKIAIGIDSCASSSFISSYPLEELPVDYLGPCDSGCFSVFIDEHLLVSPCSFNAKDIFSLEDFTFEEIWQDKLQPYRTRIIHACPNCASRSICRSCHVIPSINPCERQERTV